MTGNHKSPAIIYSICAINGIAVSNCASVAFLACCFKAIVVLWTLCAIVEIIGVIKEKEAKQ